MNGALLALNEEGPKVVKRWIIGIVTGAVAGGLALAREASPTKAPSEIKRIAQIP